MIAMDMTNREMILTSLGFFKNDHKLDTFRSYFGYDWTNEDLNRAEAASVKCLIVGLMARLTPTSTSNKQKLATDRK